MGHSAAWPDCSMAACPLLSAHKTGPASVAVPVLITHTPLLLSSATLHPFACSQHALHCGCAPGRGCTAKQAVTPLLLLPAAGSPDAA